MQKPEWIVPNDEPKKDAWKRATEHYGKFLTPVAEAIAKAMEKPASELESGFIPLARQEDRNGVESAPSLQLCFAVASCQYPAGILDGQPAYASYTRLAERLRHGERRPESLLLIGDQVYVDATAGLFDPTTLDDRFHKPYEKLLRVKPFREILRKIPTYMLIDDHEIVDNWEPTVDQVRTDPLMLEGLKAYFQFERGAGPPRETPEGDAVDPAWCNFEINGFPFFFANTRTERTPRTATIYEDATIMSETHYCRLRAWLKSQPAGRPKFIASPSILIPRRTTTAPPNSRPAALHSDAWDGYPRSFRRLLAFIAANEIQNVVFLSGDEHLSCWATGTITEVGSNKRAVINSIHSSPLYAPYPFANSVPADLKACETIVFADPDAPLNRYSCDVKTTFVTGDGFALLRVFESKPNCWAMECEFSRGAMQPPAMTFDLG
jgi:phosphodiesterase/alkaline phosphatase D-like protein